MEFFTVLYNMSHITTLGKVEERDGRTSESTDERFDDELQLKERIIVQRRHEDQLADRPEPPLTLQGVEITTNIDVRPDAIAGLDKAQKALWEFVSQRAASGGKCCMHMYAPGVEMEH